VRNLLRKYDRDRDSHVQKQLRAREDLERAPFHGAGSAARFNIGKFLDDFDHDETITITLPMQTTASTASAAAGGVIVLDAATTAAGQQQSASPEEMSLHDLDF
jgi:hypothetical protein